MNDGNKVKVEKENLKYKKVDKNKKVNWYYESKSIWNRNL